MAIIANRVKSRGQIYDLFKLLIFAGKRVSVLIILALTILLASGKISYVSALALEITGKFSAATHLILGSISNQIASNYNRIIYFKELEAENAKLKIELYNLKNIQQDRKQLIDENVKLKQLTKFSHGKRSQIASAKVISISRSPYQSRAIITAGSNQNIQENDIIISTLGLIGRVTQVSNNYSSILLIDDNNSRLPIVTQETKLKGILTRQDGLMKIIYFDNAKLPKIGEKIFTSGDGKIYPDGIKVGIIKEVNTLGVIVELFMDDDKLDYVVAQRVDDIKK